MAEKFMTRVASVASGTNKTLVNIFHAAATPTNRGRISDVVVGSVATPADQAADFLLNRTTAVGTEGSGLVPNNLDPGGQPVTATAASVCSPQSRPTLPPSSSWRSNSTSEQRSGGWRRQGTSW